MLYIALLCFIWYVLPTRLIIAYFKSYRATTLSKSVDVVGFKFDWNAHAPLSKDNKIQVIIQFGLFYFRLYQTLSFIVICSIYWFPKMLALIYIKLNKVLFCFNSERNQWIISQSPQGFILDNTGCLTYLIPICNDQ